MRTYITASALALAAAGVAGTASAADISACLITKTDTNPFFVKMKEGATAAAQEERASSFRPMPGKYDGDVETQVAAVETCIASGAKGILITPTDSRALVPVIEQAREAGALVIALDTQFEPADAADATFATDNFKAGVLIGEWAKAKIGDAAADAKIATLDLNASEVSVGLPAQQRFPAGLRHRHQGPDRHRRRGRSPHRRQRRDRTVRRMAGGRRWRTCCRSIRTSIWSTRSTNLPRPGPTRR